MKFLSTIIASLYGDGESRTISRSSRPNQILSCLRRGIDGDMEPSWSQILLALRRGGFVTEALHLMDPRRIIEAEALLDRHQVVTSACAAYPQTLLKTLGRNAPPVLWISDPAMALQPPWQHENGSARIGMGGVGCRQPPPIGIAVARVAGTWCASRGFFGISGAAAGCDSAFGDAVVAGDGDAVHFLPYGMNHGRCNGYAISVCPPREPFSTGRAMERNGLIYAMAHFTLVCSARFRVGGSWQGAIGAIRNHQAVAVADWTSTGHADSIPEHSQDPYGLAQRSLMNLGAHRVAVNLASCGFHGEGLPFAMDEAMAWACDFRTGATNGGLFAAVI